MANTKSKPVRQSLQRLEKKNHLSLVEPLVAGIQAAWQAAALPSVVPQGDNGCDVGLQQLAGEAAVVAQQGGIGPSHITSGHQGRPVEGEVKMVHPNPLDLIHLEKNTSQKSL